MKKHVVRDIDHSLYAKINIWMAIKTKSITEFKYFILVLHNLFSNVN